MALLACKQGPLFKTFEKLPTQRGRGRGRSPNLMAKNSGVSMSSVVIALSLRSECFWRPAVSQSMVNPCMQGTSSFCHPCFLPLP